MKKLKISPDFTIDDIHKIREYNYEMTKNMTNEERRAYYSDKAEKIKKELGWIPEQEKRTQSYI
jgi:precorrin-2 methylase